MPVWIKIQLIERPYYDPRTGETLESIEGRRNIPGVDPFEGGGKSYPENILILKRLSWQERGTTLLLLVDEIQEVIDEAVGLSADYAPEQLSDAGALEALITEIGLPEGTTIGADKRPVIPEN